MHRNNQIQTQKQTQKILPQQIQLLNLLQLSVVELEQRILNEVEENPALENNDLADNTEGGDTESTSNDLEGDGDEGNGDNSEDTIDYYNFDEDYGTESNFNNSKDTEQFEPIAVNIPSFQENLKQQLVLRPLDKRQAALCEYLIDTIDDDGYLRRTLEDIADDLSFTKNTFIDENELLEALKIVQMLEPVGIGSRDLTEFLMLQLREAARHGEDVSVACAIADGYIEDLALKNFEKIKQNIQISDEELRAAIQLLSSLNPKPVSGLARPEDVTRRITPDFIVTPKDDATFDIQVTSGLSPSDLRLNHRYIEMLEALDKTPQPTREQRSNAQYLRSKVSSAQWFIDALKQREDSLGRTIKTIVFLQQEFFRTGDFKSLRPMILKDIAERVELDISTISRVTSSRYVQTDFGIISLKELFTEGVLTDDGHLVSNREIQETVIEIIAQEDKKQPMTDQQIADRLAELNYNIARRTVAKYRENLNIPSAQMRRQL